MSIHRKMHALPTHTNRTIVLLSAGNLATTQAVVDQLARDMKENAAVNLNTVASLAEAAEYLGQISVCKQNRHTNANAGQNGFFPAATFILAGQIAPAAHGAYLIYPEGNFITTSSHTPYLQIGEIKYGKPVLDRFLKVDTSLHEAGRCCLISMDSTMRSNVSVGAPVDLLIYRKDSYHLQEYYCFQEDDDYLLQLRRLWHEKLKESFAALPHIGNNEMHTLPYYQD
ncbi:peptidase [Methylomonas paludis]|uniref:peptidase n=1 Tax=Methylomonas paludis TaxID=1173101 RepID=UPI0031BAEBAE